MAEPRENARRVTNAFRLGVWLGPFDEKEVILGESVTNAFRLGVWLGPTALGRGQTIKSLVTNAFRLGVWLGQSKTPRPSSNLRSVTNAFRLGVWLGPAQAVAMHEKWIESPMPFGWESG